MITIAVSSQKGGVGKTTLSVNLAHAFARAGRRTLLVDADPQGSVGLSLAKKAGDLPGFYDFMADPSLPLGQLVVPTRLPTFSLMAAGQSSDYEQGAGAEGEVPLRMKEFLRTVKAGGYELCLIDTAAGLFGVTAEILTASTAVIVPQQAEPLGIRSVPKLLSLLARMREKNPRLTVLGILLTMMQPRLAESREAARGVKEILPPELLFRTTIPRDDLFLRASARGVPVGALENGKGAMAVFDRVRREVEDKLAARARKR
ncbi:ParA family protein [Roseibacillus ishigakijimensis]|uniref:ParA family protein n=1 Tax=Roseibacillus ishigakijimensis TaxID=454146 RepID=A0A934RNR5_9BACT|nr:ParA family protein [Roseibacillus ishigakijimensis]MBK1832708.1 ParA family protein [Roseibacillus ishigakijimensis]